MLPAQSPDLARYQLALSEMDMRFSIFKQYLEMYCDNNFKPRVHAEVQILDFFHNKELKFEGSDKFVACSKPACYCCSLYFHHHPLRPVMPASHEKIYKNWKLPDWVTGDNTQRDILNRMIKKSGYWYTRESVVASPTISIGMSTKQCKKDKKRDQDMAYLKT